MDERPAHVRPAHDPDRRPRRRVAGETLEHAARVRVDHRGVDDEAVHGFAREHAAQVRDHPGERRQRIEGGVFGRHAVAGRAIEPASAGVDEARLLRPRADGRKEEVEEAIVDRAHVRRVVAGGVDDGVHWRQGSDPRGRLATVASEGLRAERSEPGCRGFGAGQGEDLVAFCD
jgi:hypothetical protein